MILQRASYLTSGALFPCLRSLVQVGSGVDLSGAAQSSLPIRKSATAPSRLQQLDAQRHSFNTSITTCSTEFEEGRIAILENNTDPVVQHRKMGAACLTMNRSESGNALNEELMKEILRQMKDCDKDEDIKAIILTGTDGVFSVGADMEELSQIKTYGSHKPQLMQAQRLRLLEFWQEVMTIRKPLIAAVDGECLGGGLEIAMACDIVYASQQSTFALPDIKVGLIPGGGGTQRLTRRVGKARAMEMILLGESMDAFEAKRYGLCTRVVGAGEVVMLAFEKAQELVLLSEPIVAMAKEVINASFEMPLEEGLMLEKREFWTSFALEDPHEGLSAFLQSRKPAFKHR